MVHVTTTGTRSGQPSITALGGADIGQCLTRIHHDRFTSGIAIADEVRTRDAERGHEHEARVLAAIAAAYPGMVRIDGSGVEAIDETLDAMRNGAVVIAGGRLVSRDGASVGAPDIIFRVGDGYTPVEIKNHKVTGSGGIPAIRSAVTSLDPNAAEPAKFRGSRKRDLFQVSHYRYLLSEIGFAASEAIAGVIGSETPYQCLWIDLDAGDPSLWDEYTSLRIAAEHAIEYGDTHQASPLADPWWRGECKRCSWGDRCAAQLSAVDDVTLLTQLSDAARTELRSAGITRIGQIAELTPDDVRVPDPSVVYQARARTAGQLLRFDVDATPMDGPDAPVEIDFDIETYGGAIYLAGFLITRNGVSTYEPIADWTGTDRGERDLVAEMFEKLASWAKPNEIIQHWTDYEQRTLAEAGRRHDLTIPGYPSVDSWFDNNAVDLCDWTRKNLASPNGYSLKVVAPLCGFSWRDDDPGGRQSEIWFERFVSGENEMRERLLRYNEDDVIAQLAIRNWVRDQDSGAGPGSSIPSVVQWSPSDHPMP